MRSRIVSSQHATLLGQEAAIVRVELYASDFVKLQLNHLDRRLLEECSDVAAPPSDVLLGLSHIFKRMEEQFK